MAKPSRRKPQERSPRYSIVLSPLAKSALVRLGNATGKASAAIVSEMVEEAVPMLEKLADAAEAVKAKRGEALQDVAIAIAEAQVRAAQASVDVQRAARGKRGER